MLRDAQDITTSISCLSYTGRKPQLLENHAYYYQIQTQMTVCHVDFCDFVVWGPNVLHIERVRRNDQFCRNIFSSARQFFRNVILPELLSRYYTRQDRSREEQPADTLKYCFCRGPDTGKMVASDNEACSYKSFHFSCVGLKRAPKEKKWFCPECK